MHTSLGLWDTPMPIPGQCGVWVSNRGKKWQNTWAERGMFKTLSSAESFSFSNNLQVNYSGFKGRMLCFPLKPKIQNIPSWEQYRGVFCLVLNGPPLQEPVFLQIKARDRDLAKEAFLSQRSFEGSTASHTLKSQSHCLPQVTRGEV